VRREGEGKGGKEMGRYGRGGAIISPQYFSQVGASDLDNEVSLPMLYG